MISFTIFGPPKGKGRPRARQVRTGSGRSFIQTYTPADTRKAEQTIQEVVQQLVREGKARMLERPVHVQVTAHLPIPASQSKRKQAQMLSGEILPAKVPDLDNIVKLVTDAINGVLLRDDKQICVLSARKRYGASPRVEVAIAELGGDPA